MNSGWPSGSLLVTEQKIFCGQVGLRTPRCQICVVPLRRSSGSVLIHFFMVSWSWSWSSQLFHFFWWVSFSFQDSLNSSFYFIISINCNFNFVFCFYCFVLFCLQRSGNGAKSGSFDLALNAVDPFSGWAQAWSKAIGFSQVHSKGAKLPWRRDNQAPPRRACGSVLSRITCV